LREGAAVGGKVWTARTAEEALQKYEINKRACADDRMATRAAGYLPKAVYLPKDAAQVGPGALRWVKSLVCV
jgi:hypothetical protein